jgi:hypothetical protein
MRIRLPVAWTEEVLVAGYSGTPLARKLGIKPGSTMMVVSGPANYRKLLAPLPAGVTFVTVLSARVDLVHVFSTSKTRLATALTKTLVRLRPDSAIWVSWPKKASKVPTDITEDTVRELALPMGLVDIKVCAVDEVWSGLKLVLRREHRPARGPKP